MSMLTPRGAGAYRPGRRGRGRRLLGLVVVLLLLAGAGGGGWWWLTQRTPGHVATTAPRPSCPPPSPAPTVVPAAQVTVNVYNGTERRGLAATVATELTRRQFRVGKVTNDPLKRKVPGLAEVRASVAGRDAARTLAAHVGEVVAVPDQRKDASVDLVLGASFKALRAPAAAAAALTPTPAPRPSGC
jgi:LytR cell envelope-related transcriptional attenuator